MKKALRKSVGEASETGSEHSAGLRGSTEIPPVTQLPTPPARGILKKQQAQRRRSMEREAQRRRSAELSKSDRSETEPLRGLQTKGPLPNSPLPWLKAMPARPLPPTPPDDPDDYLLGPKEGSPDPDEESICDSQCPSQCSCDSMDKKSLSDFDDDEEGEYTDEEKDCSHDAETQTDPEPETSAPPPRGMPRDVSSDSLGETKNKILKLKNINDLLRQIDEQFSSVLRQTAAANDFSPTMSDESPLSEDDRQSQQQRLSNVLSSPEPLPSPSCIVSPISHQPPHSPDRDDSTLPIRGSRGTYVPQYNFDPLNILSSPLQGHGRRQRSSTPKRDSRTSPVRTTQPLMVNTSEPVIAAVPYRGSFRGSPGSGSSSPARHSPNSPARSNSPRSPHSPSPRPSASKLPIKHPHRPANSPNLTPEVAQAARLTHPLLDGYPFKRTPSNSSANDNPPNVQAATGSEGYRSDKSDDDRQNAPKVIIREIPKKPAELEFPSNPSDVSLDEVLSSPENINV